MYKIQLLKKIKNHLKKGGVIAYPTEFCYGIGCDPQNFKAIQKILSIKRRDSKKGLIVVGSKLEHFNKLVHNISFSDFEITKKYAPHAVSILAWAKDKVLANLKGKHKKLAIRLSHNSSVTRICNFLDEPLVSTSANINTLKPIVSYRQCLRTFKHKVLVIPRHTGFAKKPSIILDIESLKILRN